MQMKGGGESMRGLCLVFGQGKGKEKIVGGTGFRSTQGGGGGALANQIWRGKCDKTNWGGGSLAKRPGPKKLVATKKKRMK